jgi:hypothetical protein
MIKPHNSEIGMWTENVLQKLAKRIKPHWLCWLKNIRGSWRKIGDTGLPEGSNRKDSSKPKTGPINGDHGVQGSPGGGWCNTL